MLKQMVMYCENLMDCRREMLLKVHLFCLVYCRLTHPESTLTKTLTARCATERATIARAPTRTSSRTFPRLLGLRSLS